MLIPRAAVYFEIISQLVVNGEPIALSLSVKVNIDAQLDEVWVTSWDVCEVGNPILDMSGLIPFYVDFMLVF